MPFITQPSFTAGELAPSLQARIDLGKYAVGVKTMTNFFCHGHGGVSNRAGTYYVGEVEDSDETHRLIPFIYNSSQAYALVFGNTTLRFVAESGGAHGYVLSGAAPYEVVTPYSSGELADLSYTQSADVMYLFHPDYPPYKLSRLAHDSWTLAAVAFVDGPYRARSVADQNILITPANRVGNNVALIASAAVFAAKDVGSHIRLGYINPNDATDVKWGYGTIDQVTNSTTARMDVTEAVGFELVTNSEFKDGFFGWEDHSTINGTVNYHDSSGMIRFYAGAAGVGDLRQQIACVPYEPTLLQLTINTIPATGQLQVLVGTTSGASDVKSSTVYTTTGTKNINFIPAQEDIFITVVNTGSAAGDSIYITAVQCSRSELGTGEWRIGAFNATDGYPRAGGFFEQRLCMAGTLAFPLTFWGSKVGDFENFGFSSPYQDSDAFTFRFDSGQVNDVQWMVALSKLLIGTSGAEWRVQGFSSEAISPVSIDARPESYNGSAKLAPLVIGNTVLYVQRGASVIRDLAYSLEVDGYRSEDRSILANHLFDGYEILEWTHTRLPDPIIWVVRDDGTLLGLTYIKDQEVWGWHKHETQGEYESICVTPGESGDSTYLIVKRTVNGATKRYIEVFKPRVNDEDVYDYFFVDSGLTYSGAAATSISGLDHLEGEEVAILADGAVLNPQTVSSGAITLTTAATLVHVGLAYTSDLELLGVNTPDDYGSSQGRTKSIPFVSIRFEKTRAAWAGPDEDHLDEIPFRDASIGESPTALFTGDKEKTFNSGYDTDGRVFIRNVDPTPITVLSVTPNVELSER